MNTEKLEGLLIQAHEHNARGNHNEAEGQAKQVLAELHALELGSPEQNFDKLRVQALNSLANTLNNRGDYSQALPVATQAMEIAIKFNNKSLIGNIYNIQGISYSNLSDYSKALDCYAKALAIAEEMGEKALAASIAGNIGLVYSGLSDYPRSMEYYAKALAGHEELGDITRAARATGNIGNVYLSLSDYPRALEYHNKALAMHRQLGNKPGIASANANIGILYCNLSDYDRALDYMGKALSLLEELGNDSAAAVVTGNIGNVYYKLADYPRALEYYMSALAGHLKSGKKLQVAMVTADIGEVYATKQYEGYNAMKAEEYLLRAIADLEELEAKSFEPYKILAGLYKEMGRFSEALVYSEKFHSIKEEVQSEEAKKQAQKFAQQREMQEREKQLAVEQASAEAKHKATQMLLHKVLPNVIAERMINGETEIADYYPAVSVLFADIEGFTPISADMPAYMVVRFLNHVFREFDRIMKRHGCEKIKTIGDGYMAIAGAPLSCDDHAERLAKAALDMIKPIELPDEISEFIPEGRKFNIRIGLHTGAVVAGVVGEDRFVYDAYSDTVNTASRMESHGEAGKIQVSSDFMRHLLNRFAQNKISDHGLIFEKRGEIDIKGKGKMKTFFLERK